MSESGPLKGTTFGTQSPTVQSPTVQNAGGAADLSQFGNTDDTEADDAKKRDALTEMLTLLGFQDLPATRTDLMNQAAKLQALQAQITEAIKSLQAEGADMAGAGNIAGPPAPEVATKIAALNDLQVQLKESAETFQNYAYSYFASQEAGVDKPLSLSQGQILRAYNEGVINKAGAAQKLKELKMSDGDIAILLKLEAPKAAVKDPKDMVLKVQRPQVLSPSSTAKSGDDGGAKVRAEDGSYVPASFYNNTSSRQSSSRGRGSGGGGEARRMTQSDLDALAAKLLERAKGGR